MLGENGIYNFLGGGFEHQYQFRAVDGIVTVLVFDGAVQALTALQQQLVHHVFGGGVFRNWIDEIQYLLFPFLFVGTLYLAPLLEVAFR